MNLANPLPATVNDFQPVQIWSKYEDESEWQIELVPENIRRDSPTTFQHWWQVHTWFGQLQQDLCDLASLKTGMEFRIVPSPADGANEPESPTTENNSPATSAQ